MNQYLVKVGSGLVLLAAIGFSGAAAQAQIAIPPSSKVTPDTTKPGFNWTIFANGANQANDDVRPENALAGLLKDADGNPLPNLADASAQGVAIGTSTAPNPANATIKFEIGTVINVSHTAGTSLGTFTPDEQMPGVPASDGSLNGLSVEILTYLDLPAGVTTMGVNSDDGFVTSAGNIVDAFSRTVVGSFVGGRGAGDTIFTFSVAEAGVYPFRTVYEQGGGDANIEWWTVKADGTTRVLVNDTANGGIKAYRARVGSATVDTYIKSVTPGPAARQFNKVSPSLSLELSDGDAKTVDDTSIVLQVDGQTVAPTNARVGKILTVTYTPAGLQVPTDKHTASLTYKDSLGASRTQAWTFYNLKNIVVPAPKITDDFESYPEDSQPTGWVATNFTVHCDDGRDTTSQNSESFENWVLVNVANAPSIDPGAQVVPEKVAPGQTFNGQPVTSISAGNILYAESDSRCGNADPGDGSSWGQTQFIVSKPFDCSQITNVLLTLSSLYTQNQDSIGGIEYSVDGGTNWLPIVYFLEQPDIVIAADGTVDAVATFTSTNSNRDTSGWFVNGVPKGAAPGGHGYGDALAAPITQDLGIYVAPRVNDDQIEGARIEVFRLPAASKKSDVRLRFSAMGTDSWWFAVDNIAFYDIPSAVQPTPPPAVTVPAGLAVSPPTSAGGGSLKGEYWKRPPISIPTDGATNPTNRIDKLITGFGTANGTFQAKKLVYLGNDLTHITNWLSGDAGSFVGATNNLDDGAVRLSGYINVAAAGTVKLGTTSDDGSRITIGGIDIINNDGSHGDVTMDTNVNFTAAGLYPIEITYWNGDWTSDGTGANLNHSGSTDPSLHGGANFHLRVAGADVTTAGAAAFHSTAPVVFVPGNLAINPAVSGAGGGSLNGEYWKRPPVSIPTDGATNPTNRIDKLIKGFGTADGTFQAKKFVYLGNDLTHVTNWLAVDAGSFVGDTNNLDDGAFRLSGFINVTNAGTVSLGTTSDDGSRITIGGLDILNNDSSHGDVTMDTNVNFAAAGLYPIEITYFNGDWTSDGTGANLNHSGNPDPSVHGGANFHLRVAGADVTTAGAAIFRSTAPVVIVPGDLAVSPAVSGAGGGNLNGEYWKRPPVSIPTDGATNPTNRIDALINGFGPADGTFRATKLVYLGNDLTHITNWLAGDTGSFAGATNNLDDGAVRIRGFINVTNAGTVRLGTTSDDGSRITIAGLDVINNDGSHGDATMDTNVNFSAAGLYPIEITYWNGDWTSDGTGANLNHSGSPDPSLHGGANFHLRIAGADVTTAGAAIFRSTAPVVIVPGDLAVSDPLSSAGGSLKGEYWKRPVWSIPTDGATNPTNRIDSQIEDFGLADATFHATTFVYLGNDLTHVTNWLAGDAESFVGATNNLDDGAFRFSGYINVPTAGTVRLGTTSDDGSRITIAGLDVINNDSGHGDATQDTNVNFRAAGLYPIEITYFNGDWTSDGTGANLNHSGNPDPSVHGGANFHLRVSGADVTTSLAAMFHPALITWVAETGGDNEATDTITAKWTGQTIPVSVAGEPVPGLVVGDNYSVGFFGNHAPAYVDRAHRYNHASSTVLIPPYLFGGEYIMNGNDNRDNATMTMDVTVSQAVQVYLLIDDRLGDTNNANPPTFDATHMQWVLDQGWAAVMTGNNRTGSATDPDEVGIDESADGTIDNWFSVYTKTLPAGTFQLKQADNTGQNMYGVVVTQPVGTPPDTSLSIKLQGTSLVITVPAGYRLQRTASLSAPVTWTDVPGTSPYTVPLSGAQGYYRGISP